MEEQSAKIKRSLRGTVVSNQMEKTLVVEVTRAKEHPKYKKRYQVSKKYHVHDAKGEYQVGDRVTFKECRPLSKTKRFYVVPKAEKK